MATKKDNAPQGADLPAEAELAPKPVPETKAASLNDCNRMLFASLLAPAPESTKKD